MQPVTRVRTLHAGAERSLRGRRTAQQLLAHEENGIKHRFMRHFSSPDLVLPAAFDRKPDMSAPHVPYQQQRQQQRRQQACLPALDFFQGEPTCPDMNTGSLPLPTMNHELVAVQVHNMLARHDLSKGAPQRLCPVSWCSWSAGSMPHMQGAGCQKVGAPASSLTHRV